MRFLIALVPIIFLPAFAIADDRVFSIEFEDRTISIQLSDFDKIDVKHSDENGWFVVLELNSAGKREIADATKDNIGTRAKMFVCETMISDPKIRTENTDGLGHVGFGDYERGAKALADLARTGDCNKFNANFFTP